MHSDGGAYALDLEVKMVNGEDILMIGPQMKGRELPKKKIGVLGVVEEEVEDPILMDRREEERDERGYQLIEGHTRLRTALDPTHTTNIITLQNIIKSQVGGGTTPIIVVCARKAKTLSVLPKTPRREIE